MRVKLYFISVIAVSQVPGEEDIQRTRHLPLIEFAETIEKAAAKAKDFALEKWKTAEGWFSHQAVIIPFTPALYKSIASSYKGDALNLSEDEEGSTFNFDNSENHIFNLDDFDGEILM